MESQNPAVSLFVEKPWSRWLLGSACILMVLAGGAYEYLNRSVELITILYLIPLGMATWFVSVCAGRGLSIVVASLVFVRAIEVESSMSASLLNAGIRLAVCMSFVTLLDYLRRRREVWPIMSAITRLAVLGLACVAALSAIAWQLHGEAPAQAASQSDPATLDVSRSDSTVESASNVTISGLAARLDKSLEASRPVLLGSRDPNGPSCVNVINTGDVQNAVPGNVGDFNGGPGTTIGMLYYFDRMKIASPMRDLNWHQTRLKTYLQNQSQINRTVGATVHKFAEEARVFSENVNSWTTLPAEMTSIGFTRESDWMSYCLASLDNAVRERKLDETRRWASELAAAAFALEDLHLWLQFLCDNELVALEFQQRCESLFSSVEALKTPYDSQASISQLPAGVLCMNGLSNYYEVERQAERLFATPKPLSASSPSESNFTSGSVSVMPELRDVYLDMQSVFGPDNKVTWELASKSPYHHSYMVNMLYRSKEVKTVDQMRAALKKFDSIYPKASMGELMSALMYRGHSFAGLEWGDRFQEQLVAAGDEISTSKSDSDALMAACHWTNKFYKPENYGTTLTLRDAIDQRKLDCVRATDMIGSIFRNAGRTRFGHVRWSSETMGHSVAAFLGTDKEQPRVIVVDGLNPTNEPEIWPDAYFNGHEWPANLTNNPTPYSVELYGRGIDGYIWLEGYIIRGPNAGHLTKSAIPYSLTRQTTTTTKVYDGPYPR